MFAALLLTPLSLNICVCSQPGAKALPSKKPIPAFEHQIHTQFRRGKPLRLGKIVAHPVVLDTIALAAEALAQPVHKPMLIEPRKWTKWNEGAYLLHSQSILRTRHPVQRSVLRHASIQPVFDALNYVSSVPWKVWHFACFLTFLTRIICALSELTALFNGSSQINRRVLDVMHYHYESGGGFCELPNRYDEPLPAPINFKTSTPEQIAKYTSELSRIKLLNRNMYSLRCDWTYRLEQAKEFSMKRFWFPLNLDWRGRAYPIPPHLNHLGSDLCRGIIRVRIEPRLPFPSSISV